MMQKNRSEDLVSSIPFKRPRCDDRLDFLDVEDNNAQREDKPLYIPPISESEFCDLPKFSAQMPSSFPSSTYINNQTYIQQQNNNNIFNININGYVVVVNNNINQNLSSAPRARSRCNSIDDLGCSEIVPQPELIGEEVPSINFPPLEQHEWIQQNLGLGFPNIGAVDWSNNNVQLEACAPLKFIEFSTQQTK